MLDPPPFARGRARGGGGRARLQGDQPARRCDCWRPAGVLATFSCSHHVSAELFETICRDAAADAGVTLRVLAQLTQSADHPILLTVPETRYLKGLLLEAV